jgi:hypothetical protein
VTAIVHPVEIGGVPYRLHFKFGTIRLFEREMGRPLAEVFDFVGKSAAEVEDASARIPLDAWSAFFWAVLQPTHLMTREASDALIDDAGLETVVRWLFAGFAAYNAGDPALLEIALRDTDAQGEPAAGNAGGNAGRTKKAGKSRPSS